MQTRMATNVLPYKDEDGQREMGDGVADFRPFLSCPSDEHDVLGMKPNSMVREKTPMPRSRNPSKPPSFLDEARPTQSSCLRGGVRSSNSSSPDQRNGG